MWEPAVSLMRHLSASRCSRPSSHLSFEPAAAILLQRVSPSPLHTFPAALGQQRRRQGERESATGSRHGDLQDQTACRGPAGGAEGGGGVSAEAQTQPMTAAD